MAEVAQLTPQMAAKVDAEQAALDEIALTFDEHHSDVGNARWFVRLQDGSVRYVRERGRWILRAGAMWRESVDGEIERRAKAAVGAILRDVEHMPSEVREKLFRHVLKSEQAPRLAAVLTLAGTEEGVSVSQVDLDRDPWLLGLADHMVVDLRTGLLADATALREGDYVTRQAGCRFNTYAKCPTWLAFLDRVMDGEVAMIEFLQRAIGYSLTGDTREQCMFICHGPGANGKSVFLRTVSEVLGAYGATAAADAFINRRDGAASNDLARLAGARFVNASEIDEGKSLAEALVKSATGGEAISARFLYREFFSYVPAFKIWLGVNHKPRIRGDDNGIWRRIRLVPFGVTIPPEDRDRELLTKLRRELPGILNWAIEGCGVWQREGLRPPATVLNATEAYRAESDVLGEWLDERCVLVAGASIQAKLLYADYRKFIEERGGHPLSMTSWGLRMADRGFQKDEGRLVHYRGIGLCDSCDSRDQFPVTSPYTRTRGDLGENSRNSRNSRNDGASGEYSKASRGE